MLQSSSNTCDMDSICPWGNRPTKKEEKDSGKNKSTNFALLTHLVGNNYLLLSRLPPPIPRRTRITNEIPGIAQDRNRVVTPTPLSQMSIFFRRKRGTFLQSSAITAIGKNITTTSVFGIQKRGQKTSDGLGKLHAGDCS